MKKLTLILVLALSLVGGGQASADCELTEGVTWEENSATPDIGVTWE